MNNKKTILITGGGTGIGLELARQLSAAGNTVLICGRRVEKLQQACQSIPGLKHYVCDIADKQQCQKLADDIHQDGYELDVLINNAAIIRFDNFVNPALDIDAIDNMFKANVTGPMRLVQLFLDDLTASACGTVMNICSPAGRAALKDMPVYSMTKSAFDGYTRVLRLHAKDKFNVIEVFPPTVETEMTKKVTLQHFNKMTPATCAAAIIKKWQKGQKEIWVGLDAQIFRCMDFLVHFKVFDIVNGNSGLKVHD